MFLAEPPHSEYDLHFRIAGIPVRIHPFFWLLSLFLGVAGIRDPLLLLLWVIVVFVSILVHELGHALAARHYGWQPRIVLHGMGGLAIYHPGSSSPMKQLVISMCGPLAGFAFAGLVLAIMIVGGRGIGFFGLHLGGNQPIASDFLAYTVYFLLYINIFWGLINLLPVLPLDGGRALHSILLMFRPYDDPRTVYRVSVAGGVIVGIASFVYLERPFLGVFFLLLAYQNYQMLEGGPRGPYGY